MAVIFPANYYAIVDKLTKWGKSSLIPETKVIKSYWPPIPDPTTGVAVCLPATTFSTENKSEKFTIADPVFTEDPPIEFNIAKKHYGNIDNISNAPGGSDIVEDNAPQQPSVPTIVPESNIAANSINFAALYIEAIKKSNTQTEYEENIKRFKSPAAAENSFPDYGKSWADLAYEPEQLANPIRNYYYAESTSVGQTIQITDKNKLNLAFTPASGSKYVYLWAADIASNSLTWDTQVNLKNNAGTTLCSTNLEMQDAGDVITVSGMAFETFGASPTSQVLTLNFSTENTSVIAQISNARLVAIELKEDDVFVENTTTQTTSSTSLQTAATLNFTPNETADYLIIASCEFNNNNTSGLINLQLTHDSSAYNVATASSSEVDNFATGFMQAYLPSLTAGSQTVTLDFSSNNVAYTASCRKARILALKLDSFADYDIQTDATVTTTTSTTYRNKLSITDNLDNQKRLVICSAVIGSTVSNTLSNLYRLSTNDYPINETKQENRGGSTPYHPFQPLFGSFFLQSERNNNQTISYQYRRETIGSSFTAKTGYVTLSTLALTPASNVPANYELKMLKIFDRLDDAKVFLNDISVKPITSTSRVVRPKENYEMFSTKIPCAMPGVLNCYIGVYDNVAGRKE